MNKFLNLFIFHSDFQSFINWFEKISKFMINYFNLKILTLIMPQKIRAIIFKKLFISFGIGIIYRNQYFADFKTSYTVK